MEHQTLISFTSILALLLIVKLLFSNKTKLKNRPPSPPSLPIIGHLHLINNKVLHQALTALADRYGPVLLLRFGFRNVLVVSSPAAADECFTTNDIVFANRPQLPSLKDLSYNFTTLPVQRYGHAWRNSRRISTVEILSTHRLLSFTDVREDEVRSLVRLLLRKHSALNEHEFAKIELKANFFELSMNILMRMMAGKRYYGEGNEMSEQASRFRRITSEVRKLVVLSNPGDFLPVLRWVDYKGVLRKLRRLHETRDEFLQELIDEHRGEEVVDGEKKKTMIGNLLELQRTDPENYTDFHIKSLFVSILQAGTITSSDTVEWAMSLLLNHPSTLTKLREEIDKHVGNDRLLHEFDINNLPYLHNVINETLRLKPAAPLLLPHESSNDCTVNGYDVPGETVLMVNIHAIQRDPKVWNDPLKFIPERFEKGEVSNWMIPFGMGRRKCVGEGLATRVIALALGTLVQCFDWKRVSGEEEIDMSETSGIAMSKLVPLELMYRPRLVLSKVLSELA